MEKLGFIALFIAPQAHTFSPGEGIAAFAAKGKGPRRVPRPFGKQYYSFK